MPRPRSWVGRWTRPPSTRPSPPRRRSAIRSRTCAATSATRPRWRARWCGARFARPRRAAIDRSNDLAQEKPVTKKIVAVKVNGSLVEKAVEPRMLLIHFLREECHLTGAHIGCETSHCGACTVDVDGRSVKSCTHLAVQCEGSDVRTVEGLAKGGVLHAVQDAFYREHG